MHSNNTIEQKTERAPLATWLVEWVPAETAGLILGVNKVTVAKYAHEGLVESRMVKPGGPREYEYGSLLSFADQYPAGPGGRRKIGRKTVVSRNVYYRPTTKGEPRYALVVQVNGKTTTKTYKTVGGAERARDRLLAERVESTSPPPPVEDRGVFARILARLRNPKNEEAN